MKKKRGFLHAVLLLIPLLALLIPLMGGGGDQWKPIFIGVPSARAGHTAVWTGTQMIVWGGYYFIGLFT